MSLPKYKIFKYSDIFIFLYLLYFFRERIGIRLLKKMGWRPGQGIGPRLTKREKIQKNKKQIKKVYGCSLPNQEQNSSGNESTSSDDEEYADITFAPDDYEPYKYNMLFLYFSKDLSSFSCLLRL